MKNAGLSIGLRIGLIVALIITTFIYAGNYGTPARAAEVKGKIVFETDRDGYEQIYIMGSDGSNQTNLSGDTSHDDYFPTWSSDGKQIVFVSYYDSKAHIVVMEPDGSHKKVVFETKDHIEQASLSPDGILLVYANEVESARYQIYTVGVDGKDATNVSNDKKNDKDPVWSPDGKQIAFTSSGDSTFHIIVMNADGS